MHAPNMSAFQSLHLCKTLRILSSRNPYSIITCYESRKFSRLPNRFHSTSHPRFPSSTAADESNLPSWTAFPNLPPPLPVSSLPPQTPTVHDPATSRVVTRLDHNGSNELSSDTEKAENTFSSGSAFPSSPPQPVPVDSLPRQTSSVQTVYDVTTGRLVNKRVHNGSKEVDAGTEKAEDIFSTEVGTKVYGDAIGSSSVRSRVDTDISSSKKMGSRIYPNVIRSSSARSRMGKKIRNVYLCSSCGYSDGQWWGSCRECGVVGTMTLFTTESADQKTSGMQVSENAMRSWLPKEASPIKLNDVYSRINDTKWRIPLTGKLGAEVERVLGGGLVPGCKKVAQASKILFLYSSTDIEEIIEQAQRLSPKALVIDSIQTVYLKGVTGSAGGLSQTLHLTSAATRPLSAIVATNTMHCHLRRHSPILCRCYATKYTGKVVTTTNKGRLSAIEVSVTAPSIISDVRGYPLPRRELIAEATKILQSKSASSSLDPFLDLSEFLQALNVAPTPSEVSEILKALKSPTTALELFHFCTDHIPNYRHDAFTYNRILLILSNSLLHDKIDKMKEIINIMEKLGTIGNISTINILIGSFDGVDGLGKCLELLKKWGLQLTCYSYKCLLQAYLRANDLNQALQVYREMRRKGYNLDSFGYNMLLHALAKDEKVDQAYKVFEDMKRKHCEPDEYTYTILIRMTGKLGKPNEALSLFEEMLSKGCKPNSMTYSTLIEALVRSRMADKTMILFSKMVENNCRPNEFTYSLILNVLAAEGQLRRMDEVVKISNKYMNKSIYAYLVRMLSKLGHASEAHRLFCNMWSFHDKGDRDAYLSMLESLCKVGKVAEAIDMLSRTHEKGIVTDTFMYNTVFSALGKSKQVPHLLDLYEKMKQDGPSADIFTYNILISSFGRAGRVEEAVRIFEELENSDFIADVVSYNSLINCLGKNGDLDEAHMRFKEMQEKGLNPDVVTYSTLIECFGKTDKVEMAYSLFNEMLNEGCYPNIVTYNILLDCLEKSGRSAEAVDLYSKLKEQGLTPDSITYGILERLQSSSQRTRRIRRQNPITGWVVSPLR